VSQLEQDHLPSRIRTAQRERGAVLLRLLLLTSARSSIIILLIISRRYCTSVYAAMVSLRRTTALLILAGWLPAVDSFVSRHERKPKLPTSQPKYVIFRGRIQSLSASVAFMENATVSASSSPLYRVATNEEKESKEEMIDWTKYWYPIMPLNYLNDDDDMERNAVPITILDTPLVIWRSQSGDDGDHEYSIMADVCPHRRAPLSTGKIIPNTDENDENTISKTLACRYHGWQFNKEGSCTKIPMMDRNTDNEEKPATLSKAFCARAYPTQQRDGLLWVYMDPTDTNPPALPAPIMAESDVGSNQQYSYSLNVFPVSFQSMIENSFDPSHAPFTHEALDPNKKSFITYLSSNAIPMERYELATDRDGNQLFSKDGFTV
jgi:nitrite reductase/ring-hydroxylating ferredoxin subunit